MSAIISVEGVMRTDTKDPIPEGIKLFRTLVASYRVVLSTTSDRKEIEHWAKSNFIVDFANILTSEDSYYGMELKRRHIDLSKQDGVTELFIDSDADICAMALAAGVPTMLFATPKYFKSSRAIKPWDAITEEQLRQKQVIAERYANSLNSHGSNWE